LDIESDNTESAEGNKTKKTAKERFFAIDARSWPKVCELGMPAAVSYLVLACGSGGDQTTTKWSVDAITRHTGIGRPRARQAIEALVKAGLIRIEKGGKRPQYSILHAHKQSRTAPEVTDEERRIYGIIAVGNNAVPKIGRHDNVWQHGKPYETALSLTHKGYLKDLGGHRFTIAEPEAAPEEPDLIWLPSSLVDSGGCNLTPVEQIRQSNDIRALRFFVDLYHAHDLINEPGINWRSPHGLRVQYERVKLGEHGQHVVWGFRRKASEVYLAAPFCAPRVDRTDPDNQTKKFWNAFGVLTSLHLIEPVVYLVDSDSAHGETMWPVEGGEECEYDVGKGASLAAALMLTPGQLEWAANQGIGPTSPVLKHITDVQAIGIYRLRHRPQTEATKIWFSELTENCEAARKRFQDILRPLREQFLQQDGNKQYQGGIKA
jgi:DNA-binding transcriptional ArsR family regulator